MVSRLFLSEKNQIGTGRYMFFLPLQGHCHFKAQSFCKKLKASVTSGLVTVIRRSKGFCLPALPAVRDRADAQRKSALAKPPAIRDHGGDEAPPLPQATFPRS